MAIFNSYVKLPEGTPKTQLEDPNLGLRGALSGLLQLLLKVLRGTYCSLAWDVAGWLDSERSPTCTVSQLNE